MLQAGLDPYDERARIRLAGFTVVLPFALAVPDGMVLHELATNALGHGALAEPDGGLEMT